MSQILCKLFTIGCAAQPLYFDQIAGTLDGFYSARVGVSYSQGRPTVRVKLDGKEVDLFGLNDAFVKCGVRMIGDVSKSCTDACYYNQAARSDEEFWQSCKPGDPTPTS